MVMVVSAGPVAESQPQECGRGPLQGGQGADGLHGLLLPRLLQAVSVGSGVHGNQ